jgi:hypothetical protein
MFGVDLQQEVARLKEHANEVAERASDRVQERVRETSLTLWLGFIGAWRPYPGLALRYRWISSKCRWPRWR